MKKLLKQLLAVTTAIMMAITLLPAMANAEEGSSEATTEVKTSTFTEDTGKFRILKTDEDGNRLSGAEFKYYKVYNINSTNGTISKNLKFASVPSLPDELSGNDNDLTWANNLKNYIAKKNIVADGTLTTTDGYTSYVEDATFGYYLIVETKAPAQQGDKTYVTGDPFFLALPGVDEDGKWNYEVTSKPKVNKNGISGPEKKILTTDSKGEIKPVSKNDVHVGDYIQYQIKVRVPQFTDKSFEVTDNMPKITITDTMSKNLTFINDASHPVTVTITDKDETNNDVLREVKNYTLNPGNKGNSNDYTAFTAILQANDGFTANDRGKEVTITYYAKVEAINGSIASDLQNTAKVKVNDDSDIQGGHTDSYTYGIQLTKTLAGVALGQDDKDDKIDKVYFDLYEKKNGIYEKVTDLGNVVSANKTDEAETQYGQFVTTKNNPILIKGLSLGEYALKETTTVDGYTLLTKDVEFNLVDSNLDGNLDDANSDILSKTVDNKKGFSMPGTGGMGTYIFTIGGLVVMAGAVLLLVSSKKKRA